MKDVALRLLEKQDINYNQRPDTGQTAFMWACYNNMKEVAMKLLKKSDLNYNHVNIYNNTAFTFACRNNLEDIAMKLLDKKDLNYNIHRHRYCLFLKPFLSVTKKIRSNDTS